MATAPKRLQNTSLYCLQSTTATRPAQQWASPAQATPACEGPWNIGLHPKAESPSPFNPTGRSIRASPWTLVLNNCISYWEGERKPVFSNLFGYKGYLSSQKIIRSV
ncbi:hypothetical protein NDU88_000555 [Pleurodeles waltl]|uniref:Uncharacterized protein n=1 Tax=Pleurodeles waltl TaxID=8319 RepID=A0AAV7KME0_PLEWA|nr:hypothetical protein NDU88_000555 [Pleurodeles waltl]